MEAFIGYTTLIALPVVVILTYLKINKIWERKQIREVAESVSVAAMLLSMLTTVPLLLQFTLLAPDPMAALRFSVSMIDYLVFFLIGIGFWAIKDKRIGIWQLMRHAFRMEAAELTNLIRGLSPPRESQSILRILRLVAAVDQTIDEREVQIIESVAGPWGIKEAAIKEGLTEIDSDISKVRQAFLDYIHMEPPADQAKKVYDLMRFLIRADGVVTPDEQLVLQELGRVVRSYMADGYDAPTVYEVLVVPQKDDEIEAIAQIVGNPRVEQRAGGEAYVAGTYFSLLFAEEVCQRYRARDYFSTVETLPL
jgi:tellurite resistance protein